MGKLTNLLRGTVTVTATGLFPERLLNLCAQQSVPFWKIIWRDDHTVTFTTHRNHLEQLTELSHHLDCDIIEGEKRGIPYFLARFRRRYAFLLGLFLSLMAVTILSSFVLTVEVTGNERVSTGEILNELRYLGLGAGVYGPGLDRTELAQRALLELPELSWLAINLYGTRAEVLVREEKESPKLEETQGISDIVAQTDGLIVEMQVLEGEEKAAEGDTVLAGEVLISGMVELKPPEYSEAPSQWLETQAKGTIWARTWRTLVAEIPLTTQIKVYTGENQTDWSLEVLNQKINFFGKGSILEGKYDKITKVRQLVLPGEISLPIYLMEETWSEYQLETAQINRDAAQTMLEEQLHSHLEALLAEDEEIVTQEYSAQVTGDSLQVTLRAECREEIGQSQQVKMSILGENPVE